MLSTVRDLKAPGTEASGRPFASLLVVKKLAAKSASNGNPFYSVDLGDRTGSFGCTIFSDNPAFEVHKAGGEGAVVRIEGKIDFYHLSDGFLALFGAVFARWTQPKADAIRRRLARAIGMRETPWHRP